VHHSLGGSYLGLGGLPRELQVMLRNILIDRIVPPGLDDCEATESLFTQVITEISIPLYT